jgi:heat shock protein HslJ
MVLAADGAAALQIDCNRAVGRFDLNDNALRFTPFAVTRALCPDEDSTIVFLPHMQSVSRYVFSHGRLALITEGDGAVLYFVSLN